MELQFQVNQIPMLRQLKSEIQTQEQTQEVRLNDSMPDAGRILAAWGQPVIRGKEWRGDEIGVNGGVMAWVLYAPEDGGQAQWIDCWIPFSLRWSIPKQQRDGTILCQCNVKSVDARILSGRKLLVRTTVSVLGQAYAPCQVPHYTPAEIPEDVQLNEILYPVSFISEMGEKAFVLDEDLTLPASVPELDRWVRFSLQPEITDQKVMGDKAVFRGSGIFHLLYKTPEGAMASWDFEIPFSQYTELQQEYSHSAQVRIWPLVTSVELEQGEQGKLVLKAGISGQYVLCDTREISVTEDAYSTQRAVTPIRETVEIPELTQWQSQRIRVEQTGDFASSRVADVAFNPDGNEGTFQTLYYDPEGVLQVATTRCEETSDGWCAFIGKSQATAGADRTILTGEMQMESLAFRDEPMTAISGLSLGEATQKDPMRPSLILQRAGQEGLWNIAKKCGSTVEAIREANGLTEDPEPEKMLLIPVP